MKRLARIIVGIWLLSLFIGWLGMWLGVGFQNLAVAQIFGWLCVGAMLAAWVPTVIFLIGGLLWWTFAAPRTLST